MSNVVAKALAAILDENGRLLVQCDLQESFYRLPGGSIEFDETGKEAVARELHEEYRLSVEVGRLLALIENRFSTEGSRHHEIVFVYLASLASPLAAGARLPHCENDGIQLVWRDLVGVRPKLVPPGLGNALQSNPTQLVHLVV